MSTDTMTIEELKDLVDESAQRKEAHRTSLSARTQEILRMHLKERMTLQAIATKYGLTRQRVHQIIQKGVEKLSATA